MSFDRGAPAFWFVEIFLDASTIRIVNSFEAITFDGQTYSPVGDRMRPPADIDRAADLKSQKFEIGFDSSRQTDNADPLGAILDANWRRRPVRVRYATGDYGATAYDFSDPFVIVDEAGRIKDIEDTISAGETPFAEIEIESGALVFLERRMQTRSPANQRAMFPGDAFFDLAPKLDGVTLPWRTKRAKQGSTRITYDVDGSPPREFLFGRGITKGSFVFGATVGQHRGRWHQIWALADHRCEALEEIYINGAPVLKGTVLAHGVKTPLLAFRSSEILPIGYRLWVTWYDGRHDQTADAELITLTASQDLKWTSEHRGRGVSYVKIEHAWDSDNPDSFTYEFQLKGARVYQERFDDTAGGSGSQRWNDPATWTFSTNAADATRHFLRGIVANPDTGGMWFGVGADVSFLDPYAVYAAQAAHAAESVPLKLGGTQPRYEANGWLSAQNDHKTNLQRLADTMVARAVDEGSRISIRLNIPQSPVVELFDSDLISDEDSTVGVNARADDVVNRIEGRFQDPANKYSSVDYPAVSNAAFEEVDGAELTDTWNQPLEISEERAQRKATLYLNRLRRTLELEEHFGPKAKDVRPGDWVTRSSALRGFPSGKLFIADEVRRFVDGTVRLLLLEADPEELAWDEENAELTPVSDGPQDPENPALGVPEITVTAIAISGGDVTVPAVRFASATYDDFLGDEVLCEFGIWNGISGGGAGIAGVAEIAKIPGNFVTFDGLRGLLPGTAYAFRFRSREGERLSDWSAFQVVTMTGDYIAGASAIADAIVGQGPGATAPAADVLNSYTPNGVNQLIDHEFRFNTTFWRALSGAGSVAAATNETAGIRRRTLTGSGVTVGQVIQLDSFPDRQRFACRAGDVIEASAFASQSNCSAVRVQIAFHNAADTVIGSSSLGSFTPGGNTASLADFTRISVIGTAPAGTAYARIIFTGVASTTAPVLHIAKPMLAVANANQTTPSAWSPGFNGTPGADPTISNTAAAVINQGTGATANNLAGLNATDNANLTQSLSTSRRLIVSDFSADGRHWTNAFGGTPEAVADPTAEGYADVTGIGRVIRFNAFPRYLTPKGAFAPVPGRRYALIARVRTETAPSGGAITFGVSINGLSSAWAHGDPVVTPSAIPGINSTESPAAGTWVLVGRVSTMNASPNSFNAFWRPGLDITATGTGGRAEVSNFIILDVTDVPLGRILTGLLRADGVTAVTEAAVVTGLGTAAAIAGQGALATLNAILASLLNLADPSNMITDGDLRDSAAWTAATGWTFGSTETEVTSTMGLARAFKTVAGNGTTSQGVTQVNFPASAVRMVVEPGRPLRLAVRTLAKAGFNGKLDLVVRYGGRDGTLISAAVVATADYRSSPAGADTVVNLSAVSVPPAGTVYMQYRLQLQWPTAVNSAGHAYFGAPFMQRAAQLGSVVTLEDGTTIATDALLRTALGTAAAITGQGNQATANAARGTLAARPASPPENSWYVVTDSSPQKLTFYSGGAWNDVANLAGVANLSFSRTNTFVKIRTSNGTNTTDQVAFTGSGGSGSGYTFAHELFLTSTTGPVPTISSASGTPITVSASGGIGDEVRFIVQTTVTDGAGNKATLSVGGALVWT